MAAIATALAAGKVALPFLKDLALAIAPQLLGGLFTGSGQADELEALAKQNELNRRLELLMFNKSQQLSREGLAFNRQQLAQSQGQFAQSIGQRESEFGRDFGLRRLESQFARKAGAPNVLRNFAQQTGGRLI